MVSDRYLDMLRELLDAERGLSDWETHFFDDIALRVKNCVPLTPRQEAKIEEIW